MDQSCLRQSKMIKHMHVVVWILLIASGVTLVSRVMTDSSPGSRVAKVNVGPNAKESSQAKKPSLTKQQDRTASKSDRSAVRVARASRGNSASPPNTRPEKSSADQTETARGTSESGKSSGAQSASQGKPRSSTNRRKSRSYRTIAIGSIYEPDESDMTDSAESSIDDSDSTEEIVELDDAELDESDDGHEKETARGADDGRLLPLPRGLASDDSRHTDKPAQAASGPFEKTRPLVDEEPAEEFVEDSLPRTTDEATSTQEPVVSDNEAVDSRNETVEPNDESPESTTEPEKSGDEPAEPHDELQPSTSENQKSVGPNSPAKLTIENPKRIGYPVAFLYGTELIQLQPGDVFTRTFANPTDKPKRVLFHRGGSFGDANRQLEPAHYEFQVTRQGWQIRSRKTPTETDSSQKTTEIKRSN